jgi:hypothetical protein
MDNPEKRTRLIGCSCKELSLGLLVLLLVSCTSERPEDDGALSSESEELAAEGQGENPHLNADNLCGLVPVAQVAAAAGGREPLREEPGSGPPASCRYFFDVPDGSGVRHASATLQMLSDFGLERIGAGAAATDIAGLGDEAWARSHTDSYLLYARRGNLVFSVSVAGMNESAWPDAARAIGEVVLGTL